MRPKHKTRQRNYQKVLLAVYFTAEDEDLYDHESGTYVAMAGACNLTSNRRIADAAGLTRSTIPPYLVELEANGVIETFEREFQGQPFRVMILKDHPKARAMLREYRRACGRPVKPKSLFAARA